MADVTPNTQPGNAGELHQLSGAGHPMLTTQQPCQSATTRTPSTLARTAGSNFDHERIHERVVHANGSAAHGYFELMDGLSDLCRPTSSKPWAVERPMFSRFCFPPPETPALPTCRGTFGVPFLIPGYSLACHSCGTKWLAIPLTYCDTWSSTILIRTFARLSRCRTCQIEARGAAVGVVSRVSPASRSARKRAKHAIPPPWSAAIKAAS